MYLSVDNIKNIVCSNASLPSQNPITFPSLILYVLIAFIFNNTTPSPFFNPSLITNLSKLFPVEPSLVEWICFKSTSYLVRLSGTKKNSLGNVFFCSTLIVKFFESITVPNSIFNGLLALYAPILAFLIVWIIPIITPPLNQNQ